jgi:hypothetical protein
MKITIILLIIISCSSAFAQQKVFDLNNSKDTLYLYESDLEKNYPNCRMEDEDSNAFKLFYDALSSVNSELVRFARENEFNFKTDEKKIYIMHKYFVNAEGKVEHLEFMPHSELSKRTLRRYRKLLEEFIEGRTISYESQTSFAICGQTLYRLRDGRLLGPRKKT